MGFIHLDLKPQNIMKDKQGNIKLIDMGSVVEKNKDFVALGAGTYAAPEVREYIHNQPTGWFSLPKLFKPNEMTEGQSNQSVINVSGKARKNIAETADVFSIGAIFYHMLVGHEPRHIVGQDSSSIKIENILVSKSDFSSETLCFMPVLANALKAEPRKRIQTCKQLKKEIDYAYQIGYHD